jgi:sorting nexin-25
VTSVVSTVTNRQNISNSESVILFQIQVKLQEDNKYDLIDQNNYENDEISLFREGWVIYRNLKEFDTLNQSLHDILPYDLRQKFKTIPTVLRRRLSSKILTQDKIEKTRLILDDYLKSITEDESLAQSEALYTFLCPSMDYFKRSSDSESGGSGSLSGGQNSNSAEEGSKFSLVSLLLNKNRKSKELSEGEFLEDLFSEKTLEAVTFPLAATAPTTTSINTRDSIAKQFYQLIEDIFELKDQWFRKTLILFVQLTYGATINKIIRESLNWLFSRDMLAYYLKLVKDSFWKYDEENATVELIPYTNHFRSEIDKQLTKKMAKEKFLANIPGKTCVSYHNPIESI